jgi:hypothetical protein
MGTNLTKREKEQQLELIFNDVCQALLAHGALFTGLPSAPGNDTASSATLLNDEIESDVSI